MRRFAALAWICGTLILGGCTKLGTVEQGQVIAYDQQAKRVTLIRMAAGAGRLRRGILPPVTVTTPDDPNEMGPAPASGRLMLVDSKARSIVIYDVASQTFRSIPYTPLAERRLAKNPGLPVIDRVKHTITIYSPDDRILITFTASNELMAMPADTWQAGDVVRYYYKDPGRALRLMNVTKTDISKSSG